MQFGKEVSLRDFSNFRIGGPARDFVRADTQEDLREAIEAARALDMKVFVIGGGTNILVRDEGYDGLVLQPAFYGFSVEGVRITAGAGVPMPDLVSAATAHGLSGLEWAGGLPGSVGGAVYGNSGAFGGEIKDSLWEVLTLDMDTLDIRKRSGEECGFGYRTSTFKRGEMSEIVLQATFRLKNADKRYISHEVNKKINYRKEKHPLEYPSIGGIFKSVPTDSIHISLLEKFQWKVKRDPFPAVPAAVFIAEAGLKGRGIGGALISDKHPNFIVNVMDARARDVMGLIEEVKQEVKEKFGVKLEEEVGIL